MLSLVTFITTWGLSFHYIQIIFTVTRTCVTVVTLHTSVTHVTIVTWHTMSNLSYNRKRVGPFICLPSKSRSARFWINMIFFWLKILYFLVDLRIDFTYLPPIAMHLCRHVDIWSMTLSSIVNMEFKHWRQDFIDYLTSHKKWKRTHFDYFTFLSGTKTWKTDYFLFFEFSNTYLLCYLKKSPDLLFNLPHKFVLCSQGLNIYYENKCVKDFWDTLYDLNVMSSQIGWSKLTNYFSRHS
jgi:NADH:ubiquinone oxidoreductase subunit 3 (subunit A)